MPTARETLLEAAHTAVLSQPWHTVRMVDVAAAAGVSRQTLYNEFGTKEGLGAALVHRLVEGFLDGAARAAAEARRRGADPASCCAAAAGWMLRTARDEPIVHAALTGFWGAGTPYALAGDSAAVPPQRGSGRQGGGRRAAVNCPGRPGELAATLCARMVAGVCAGATGTAGAGGSANGSGPGGRPPRDHTLHACTSDGAAAAGAKSRPVRGSSGQQRLDRACEVGLRIALSYVVAPAVPDGPDDEACGRVGEVVRALLAPH